MAWSRRAGRELASPARGDTRRTTNMRRPNHTRERARGPRHSKAEHTSALARRRPETPTFEDAQRGPGRTPDGQRITDAVSLDATGSTDCQTWRYSDSRAADVDEHRCNEHGALLVLRPIGWKPPLGIAEVRVRADDQQQLRDRAVPACRPMQRRLPRAVPRVRVGLGCMLGTDSTWDRSEADEGSGNRDRRPQAVSPNSLPGIQSSDSKADECHKQVLCGGDGFRGPETTQPIGSVDGPDRLGTPRPGSVASSGTCGTDLRANPGADFWATGTSEPLLPRGPYTSSPPGAGPPACTQRRPPRSLARRRKARNRRARPNAEP